MGNKEKIKNVSQPQKSRKKKIFIAILWSLFLILLATSAVCVFLYLNSQQAPVASGDVPATALREALQWKPYNNGSGLTFDRPAGTGVFARRNGQLVPAAPTDKDLVIAGLMTPSNGNPSEDTPQEDNSPGGNPPDDQATSTPPTDQGGGGQIKGFEFYNVHLDPYTPGDGASVGGDIMDKVKTLLAKTDPADVEIAPSDDGRRVIISNKDPKAAFKAAAVFLDDNNVVTVTGDSRDINDANDMFRRFVDSFQRSPINTGGAQENPPQSEPVSVYAGGAGGAIYHFNGVDWTKMETGITDRTVFGIWGVADNDIYAVTGISTAGESGLVLHYNGQKWSRMDLSGVSWNSGANMDLYSISGTARNDIYAVGGSGTILHYDGNRWQRVDGNVTGDHLNAVWTSERDVYAAGINGTVLHYARFDGQLLRKPPVEILMGALARFAIGGSGSGNYSAWQKIRTGQNEVYYSIWGSPAYVAIAGESDSGSDRRGIVLYCRGISCAPSADYSAGPFHSIWGDDTSNSIYAGAGAYESGERKLMLLNSATGMQLGAASKKVISAIWRSPEGTLYLAGYNPDSESPAVASLRIENPAGHSPQAAGVRIWPMDKEIFSVWGTLPMTRPASPVLDALTNFGGAIVGTARAVAGKLTGIIPGNKPANMAPVKKEPVANPQTLPAANTSKTPETYNNDYKPPVEPQPTAKAPDDSSRSGDQSAAPVVTGKTKTYTFRISAGKHTMEHPLDTGIDLQDGDNMEINASGTWNIGATAGKLDANCGPDGVDYAEKHLPELEAQGLVVPSIGALTFSIGTINGGYVPAGSHYVFTVFRGMTGRLYLFCLDPDPRDNSGTLNVEVKITDNPQI